MSQYQGQGCQCQNQNQAIFKKKKSLLEPETEQHPEVLLEFHSQWA